MRTAAWHDGAERSAVAQILAQTKGDPLLRQLEQVSPRTPAALLEQEDVTMPLIETLEIISEPDGSANDEFVVPTRVTRRRASSRPDR